eukprot:CAMPEP_0115546350 /NCGR_PEP_ID=MMETSP0271-20121206/93084_1 /TAXON_ID=71861 /ORGANISM="Scrippsiella trochoidea, Strain CCMP3099" /LENGTH=510 /DNA_ID=CAMNT_0002979745 /DNA_START=24 /DNA_END=1553 /DNA_ORIENTATION=-
MGHAAAQLQPSSGDQVACWCEELEIVVKAPPHFGSEDEGKPIRNVLITKLQKARAQPALRRSGSNQSSLSAKSSRSEHSGNPSQDGPKLCPKPRSPIKKSKSKDSLHSAKSPTPSGGTPSVGEDPAPRGLRRSATAQSINSKGSAAAAAVGRPLLRRSWSAGSAISAATLKSDPSSTSVPPLVVIDELREKNSVRRTFEAPAHTVYQFVEKCGEGGFGEVWEAFHKESFSEFAIKRVPVGTEKHETKRLERELKVFERLSNPFIVKLHETYLDDEYLYLVMDRCTGGNLVHYMDTYADDAERIMRKLEFPDHVMGLPSRVVGRLMWQMLAGIAYMHHHRFCHRDIKLQNYVIKEPSSSPVLQLVDFGMAVRFQKGHDITGVVGTLKYMSPEVLNGSYSEKCDLWAIGVVCYILCTEKSPWGNEKHGAELHQCIKENIREPWPSCDKPKVLRSLVNELLNIDVDGRRQVAAEKVEVAPQMWESFWRRGSLLQRLMSAQVEPLRLGGASWLR